MPQTPQRKVTNVRQLPSGRANATHFGGLEARAVAQVGTATQSVAGDLEVIQKKHDTFVVQEAYNKVNDEALSFFNEASLKKGKNAFGVSQGAEEAFNASTEKHTEGFTRRQKNIFIQNWAPKSISYRQRISGHEQGQLQAAQLEQQKMTAEGEAQTHIRMGDPESRAQYKNSYKLYLKSTGADPDTIKMAVEKGLEDLDYRRFDTLVAAGDLEGAKSLLPEGAETSDDSKVQMQLSTLDSAERSRVKKLEDEAAFNMTQGNARLAEGYMKANDPYWIPTLNQLGQWYPDPDIAKAKQVEWTAKVNKVKAAALSDVAIAQANNQETRRSNNSFGIDIAAGLANGTTSVEQAQEALDRLALDTGDEAKNTRSLISDGIVQVLNTQSDQMGNLNLQIKTRAASVFNKANDKAVVGWFGTGRAIPGVVELKDGKVVSANEATPYFQQYMAGWDMLLKQTASEKGKSLTIPEVLNLETQYFAPMKTWKSRDDFTGAAVTTIKEMYESQFETGPQMGELRDTYAKLIEQLTQRAADANQ